jgi:predicted hotdog family 3-hydroxylacyl-ACP dehydratase
MNGFTEKITDKDFIGKLIPQKTPFVMVDKLLHFEDKKVVAGLTISEDNIFIQYNKFAAPGLIEHMAQTVALYTGYQFFLKEEAAPTGYIGAIKKVEIFELPSIGKELETTVIILHDIMGVTLITAETKCDGKTIASSEMKTVLAS